MTALLASYPTRTLTSSDPEYPSWLREAPDRPPVVHVRGALPPDRRCVACVGTRAPSTFGQEVARGLSSFLAARGWSVVSGLALGVDTICHEAALEVGGRTVAVLANGLDSVHPRQNAALARRILASGGGLLSEQPLGTPALPAHLVARNRIQSGMSAATIVMQTDLVGGTMHTAKYALLQGRLLAAPLPEEEDATEPKSRGLLALTRRTGTDLARIFEARGPLAELLARRFADRPVARAITGCGDYGALLIELENLVEVEAHPHPATRAPCTTSAPTRQLELDLEVP